jgi:CheY-like chemotaxis protein
MMILIADDDRAQCAMLSNWFKGRGHQVTIAHDAVQAWMAALRRPPDAIILDIHMPCGTGYAVLRQLKTSTKTNHVPVIVISGSISPEDEKTVPELGADVFLRKPVDFSTLGPSLDRVLSPSPN